MPTPTRRSWWSSWSKRQAQPLLISPSEFAMLSRSSMFCSFSTQGLTVGCSFQCLRPQWPFKAPSMHFNSDNMNSDLPLLQCFVFEARRQVDEDGQGRHRLPLLRSSGGICQREKSVMIIKENCYKSYILGHASHMLRICFIWLLFVMLYISDALDWQADCECWTLGDIFWRPLHRPTCVSTYIFAMVRWCRHEYIFCWQPLESPFLSHVGNVKYTRQGLHRHCSLWVVPSSALSLQESEVKADHDPTEACLYSCRSP